MEKSLPETAWKHGAGLGVRGCAVWAGGGEAHLPRQGAWSPSSGSGRFLSEGS